MNIIVHCHIQPRNAGVISVVSSSHGFSFPYTCYARCDKEIYMHPDVQRPVVSNATPLRSLFLPPSFWFPFLFGPLVPISFHFSSALFPLLFAPRSEFGPGFFRLHSHFIPSACCMLVPAAGCVPSFLPLRSRFVPSFFQLFLILPQPPFCLRFFFCAGVVAKCSAEFSYRKSAIMRTVSTHYIYVYISTANFYFHWWGRIIVIVIITIILLPLYNPFLC